MKVRLLTKFSKNNNNFQLKKYSLLPLRTHSWQNVIETIMAAEIELKAHVQDIEKLRKLLSEKAEYLYAFEKEDNYWFGAAALPRSGLRVRREKRTYPDGRDESSTLATYKIKEVRDGIEINDEQEFTVEPALEFEKFLSIVGLKPGVSKQKRGWAFSGRGINAELLEVKGLDWFLELEIIVNDPEAVSNRKEAFADEKKRLLDFLDCLGIEKEAIESRFYTDMLRTLYNA